MIANPSAPEADRRVHCVAGTVLIAGPASLKIGAIASVIVLALLIAFLSLGTYAPRQAVSGQLIPRHGLIKILARRPGTVQSVFVSEAAVVRRGQLLLTVSVEDTLSAGEGAQSGMLAALTDQAARIRQQLAAQEVIGVRDRARLEAKMAGLSREAQALEQLERTLRQQLDDAQQMVRRIETLKQQAFVTDGDVLDGRRRALDVQARIDELSKTRQINLNAQQELRFEQQQLPLHQLQSLATLRNELSRVELQMAEHEIVRTYSIVAPADGKVTALQVQSGTVVGGSMPLLTLLREREPLVTELAVPSRAIGFVSVGQEVLLRYRSFPYQHFGTYSARVVEVSKAALAPDEWSSAPPSSGEPHYRVIATLGAQSLYANGEEVALQAGMLVDADLKLEQRRLWRWLLEPVFSVRGRL